MKTFIVVFALLSSFAALAHGDHPKPIAKCASTCTKEEVEKAVPLALSNLALVGEINREWLKAKIEKVELKEFSKGKEWVVTMLDSKKKEQQKLYVFITTNGYLNGANFTGN